MPTTLETFEQLVRNRTPAELLPFLFALRKEEIGPVRQRVRSLEKELGEAREQPEGAEYPRSLLTWQRRQQLFLSGLATFTSKEATRNFQPAFLREVTLPENWPATSEAPPFLAVIRHFRPAWLGEWLARRTRDNRWAVPQYALLRELLADSLLEHDPWLTAQSVAMLPTHYNWRREQVPGGNIPGLDQLLLADLQADTTLLARDLPLLLDFDTMADTSTVWAGEQRTPTSWLNLLAALLADGHLARAEWLTHCLLALRRDFRRPLLTWVKNLYAGMQPTPAEQLARQSELLELLAHPLPLVVNFALDQLKEIWVLPGFDLAALLAPAEALLGRQELKGGLRTLLAGLALSLKADPTQAAPLARLYASTLAHADVGVQERAAKSLATLLGAKKPLLSVAEAAEATATIALYAELLGAPARTVLTSWLPAAAAPAALTEVGSYEPVTDFQPDLSDATAVAPVADWHELLFLTGQVLRHDDPLARERWLDGLLHLQGRLPADYADQLQPYLPQIIAWGREPGQPLTLEQARQVLTAQNPQVVNYPGQAQALTLSWMLGFSELLLPLLTPGPYAEPDPLVAADQQRVAFAETLLQAGRALPLLSTPTHAPHWVAPTALVQRLLAYEAAGQPPHPTDLAFALARLAWAAAADAAAATRQLPQLCHAGLRELLGWLLAPATQPLPAAVVAAAVGEAAATEAAMPGPDSPAGADGATWPAETAATPAALTAALPWLWAVAARTRQPGGEFEALAALSPPGCANVVQPLPMGWDIVPMSLTHKVTWKPGVTEETENWLELQVRLLAPVAAPHTPVALYALHPAASPAASYRWHALTTLTHSYAYLAALLPQYPAPLHWRTLALAATRDVSDTGVHNVLSAALRQLLQPGPAYDEPATLLLAVGLTQHHAAVRALALETLLAAVTQGRLVPGPLAQALGRLLSGGFVPLPRLTANLTQARALDARTDDALRQLLDALLPALPTAPLRQTGALLTLYADLPGRAAHPVPAPMLACLRAWSAASPSLKKVAAPLLA